MKLLAHREYGHLGDRSFIVDMSVRHNFYLEARPSEGIAANRALCHDIPPERFQVFQHPSRYSNRGFPECSGAIALTLCYHFIRSTLELRAIYAPLGNR